MTGAGSRSTRRPRRRGASGEAVDGCVRAGIEAIGLWREHVAETGLTESARIVADAGLRVSSYCRGGFLTGPDAGAALADNRRALDEAAALGAPCLVMVVGGLPDGSRDLVGARDRVADRIGQLVPHARDVGVRIALEPLHPMFCSDRAVLSTLGQAVELGVAVPGGGRRGRRRRLPRVVGPGGARRHRRRGGADRVLPGVRLGAAARRRRPALARAAG